METKKQVKLKMIVTIVNNSGDITELKQFVVQKDSKQHKDLRKKFWEENSIPSFNQASFKYDVGNRRRIHAVEIKVK